MTLIFIVTIAIVFLLVLLSLFLYNKYIQTKRNLQSVEESLCKKNDEHEASLKNFNTDKEKFDSEIKSLREKEEQNLKQIEILKQQLNSNSSFDGLFPICSNCKDIRDPKGYWHTIEEYIQGLSDAELSHSLCPDCARKLYPDLFNEDGKTFCLKWRPPPGKKENF